MYGHLELKAAIRGRQIARISMLWSYSCILERILEAQLQASFAIFLLGARLNSLAFYYILPPWSRCQAIPLVSVLMSTFQASSTDQGNPLQQ